MSNTTTDRPGSSSRHPVNIGHLVMGLAFAGLIGVWALITADVVDGDDVRWLLPIPWVFAGAVGLLAVTLANRRRTPSPYLADPSLVDTETTEVTETTENTEEIR
jgi:hypothetical protein